MRVLLWVAMVLVSVAACTDAQTIVDPDATALEIVVEVPADLGIDRLQLSAVGGEFAAGTVPDAPRALAGEQSVVILLPEGLDGSEVIVRVDGLAAANVVASGGARATVRARSVERVVVALSGPVTCGDTIIDPLLEPCDDNNTAAGDGCSATCTIEPGFRCDNPASGPSLCRPDTFDVLAAASVGHRLLEVTFSDPPDPTQALNLASYMVPGLALSGQPFLEGNKVRITTSAQDPIGYNVLVSGVVRAVDAKPLAIGVGAFTGRTAFNLMSARSSSATQIVLTFSDAPDAATALVLANYSVAGLTLTGTPVLTGKDVAIATAVQVAQEYTVNVTGVRRVDGEALDNGIAAFSGVNGFDVTSAVSISNRKLVVTFNAPPNPGQAAVAGNYTISDGLAVVGTPVVIGTTVELDTTAQAAMAYTVTVANVRRASDAQVLTIDNTSFTGLPLMAPTVTSVEVLSTSPDNGTTFFNTGTAVVRLKGTQFATVMCPMGVRLDDKDGAGGNANTQATSCVVDSDTQITATFPNGIRTNADAGWHVIVSNMVGANATSDTLVTRAGLLISEVMFAGSAHEFVELYNPTATAIDVAALGLRLFTRKPNGSNTLKNLTPIRNTISSHGFYLIASQQSDAADPWFAVRDATYNANSNNLDANGGVFISLSNTQQAKVLDKLGWGSQPAGGFEGNPIALATGMSAERMPAGGMGHAVDTDTNAADFNAATATPTPRGATSPAEP